MIAIPFSLAYLFKSQYCLKNVSETDWNMFLEDPSYAIYQAIKPFLNDELLNDIEKLYDIYTI